MILSFFGRVFYSKWFTNMVANFAILRKLHFANDFVRAWANFSLYVRNKSSRKISFWHIYFELIFKYFFASCSLIFFFKIVTLVPKPYKPICTFCLIFGSSPYPFTNKISVLYCNSVRHSPTFQLQICFPNRTAGVMLHGVVELCDHYILTSHGL